MKIADKLWLVTGGGSGMGRSLVLALLARGARVVTADINQKGLDETVALAGAKKDSLSTYVLNIADKEAVKKTVQQIISENGPIDGLINNAGIIQPFKNLYDLDDATLERVFNVNFWGTLHLTKTVLPYLLNRPEAHIVNVSSMGGFFAFPGQTMYGASKAAVKLMTEGLMQELRETKVKVSVVFPGAVNTNIMANSGLEVKGRQASSKTGDSRALTADKAAEIMIDGIEKNRKRIFVGKDSRMMDYMYRSNPDWAMRFIARKMKGHLS
jgi:NAD(P)-dependent dehydrogenase (short-subunit alcohol dehydrogenase family)